MTNTEKKRYLNSYLALRSRLKRLGLMYIQCDLDTMLPSIQSDGMPHAHNPHGLETYAQKRDKLERDIEKTRQELIDKLSEIVWNIEQMADETERSVLYYRYIEGMKWDDVADTVGYTRQHTDRIHGEALRHFNPSVITLSKM
jgi:DNA-directed RNA polymerase specialized sigma subunit